ncbi:MAG: IMP cyclohydrolase [Candidatus Hydrogenedentes bacterium]|nr:IMP cyclohydrolase [Candidatus Hydrogenedentota bacterium]
MPRIERAILSCHDKTQLVEFARFLHEMGVEIISTSGTLKVLAEAGIPALSIAEFTGLPELMNGRVKTLHPKVHAGLLGVRDNKLHTEQIQEYGLKWIDLVIVNLQPLSQVLEQGITADEVYEHIDIGGTAMIRSAAKNFRYVTVVVNPDRYAGLIHELRAHEGSATFPTRFRLAQEAFECCAAYDREIADYLKRTEPPVA